MTTEKIKSIKELAKIIRGLKKNKKIITTNGIFDIMHIGHLRYLQKSKSMGDILVVGINSDSSTKNLKGEKRPINNENERAEILSGLSCIDYVTIFNEKTPEKFLAQIKPNIHVKGGDYSLNQIAEKRVVEENGGKVVLLPLVEGYSTTNLINKIIKIYKEQ